MEENLTVREAYAAMYAFLEELYKVYGYDQFGGILGGMSLLADGNTADPAIWNDWLKAVGKAKAGKVNMDLDLVPPEAVPPETPSLGDRKRCQEPIK